MLTYYPLIVLNIFVMMPEKHYYFSNVKDIRTVSDKVLCMKTWYNSKNLCECCQSDTSLNYKHLKPWVIWQDEKYNRLNQKLRKYTKSWSCWSSFSTCKLGDNQHQQKSEVSYNFTPNISYGYLLNIEPNNLMFLETKKITDQNDRLFEMEDKFNLTLLIKR